MITTFKNRPRLWVGKKTREWIKVRARVKHHLLSLGITTCELHWSGCWVDNALSIAHGKKRRHLQGDELETLTILACTPCHQKLESLPEPVMRSMVEKVISNRRIDGQQR